MSHQHRFHIRLRNGRTTITVDNYLSELLALHLGHRPDQPTARTAVRQWLQQSFEQHLDLSGGPQNASRAMRRYIILELVDTKVSEAWWSWLLGDE